MNDINIVYNNNHMFICQYLYVICSFSVSSTHHGTDLSLGCVISSCLAQHLLFVSSAALTFFWLSCLSVMVVWLHFLTRCLAVGSEVHSHSHVKISWGCSYPWLTRYWQAGMCRALELWASWPGRTHSAPFACHICPCRRSSD